MILATAALLLAQGSKPSHVENPGQMFVVGPRGRVLMPLERTSVTADVAGMGARVTVRQTFVNPSPTPIEALYTFPLPHDAAVDGMRIKIGSRTIDGTIMKRDAAKAVYEAAKAQGRTAALLDQEADNVFTQSVANVMPGRRIEVEITYVQLVKFEDGQFEFTYPMVVGPRFLGQGTPNPEKIAPPTLRPGVRSGANIDLTLTLHGGAPIVDFRSVLHQVRATKVDPETVRIALAKADEMPNRDFVLRYRTASKDVSEAVFTTWDEKTGGHFALVLAPPPAPDPGMRSPKEMVFVIDQSGSQSGFPIEESKELSLALLGTMGPQDTFNVMGFSNEVDPLWPSSRPNTPENVAEAKAFIHGLRANGGTELEKAVVAALSPTPDASRVRIVLFNTDGLAGQQPVILENVRKYRGTSRLFTFGIGNGVNRDLIDAMSHEGRGASEVVTLAEGAAAARDRFAQRLENPLLVNVKASFSGGAVSGVTPDALPDVFSAKPVVVYGRYTAPGKTVLTLTGLSGGRPWRRTLSVDLPKTKGDGSSVASLWARARIAEIKSEGYAARQMGAKAELDGAIERLALDYRIMSEFTSFVAVDREVTNATGKVSTVRVPVEMTDGVTLGFAYPALRAGAPAGGASGRGRSNNATQISALQVQGQISALLSSGNSSKAMAGGRGGSRGQAGVDFVSYDPTDNSLVVVGEANKGHRTVPIAKELLEKKGEFNVRITIEAVSLTRLDALRKAGLVVGSHDGATLVFGTTTAKQLRGIAKLDFVRQIGPLRRAG